MLRVRMMASLVFGLCAALTLGQVKGFRVLALDAKTGRPITGNHVLVQYGATPDDIRWHPHSAEAKTDANGLAVLPGEITSAKYVQVWIDWHRQCAEHPDLEVIDVQAVTGKGLVVNHCSNRVFQVSPGVLTIAARDETFFEKMSH